MKSRKKSRKPHTPAKSRRPGKPIPARPAEQAPSEPRKRWSGPMDTDLFVQLCTIVLRRLVQRRQISLHQLKRLAGLDRHCVRDLLAGNSPLFSLHSLVRLCNVLRLAPSRIMETVEKCAAESSRPDSPKDKQD